MYLVSVLVPVFGVESYIERCARSLFEQTYPNLEFIFVDDCSQDRSIELLDNVINDYPERKLQVRVIKHEVNRGLAAARNTAIKKASGLFVCHVDSDDYLEKDAISLMVEKQQKEDSDIVTVCACRHYRDKVEFIRQYDVVSKEQLLLSILQPNYDHTIWGRLIRSSLYKDYDIRNQEGCDQGEDWWTVPKLVFYATSVSCIEKPLYHYESSRDKSMCDINLKKGNTTSWKKDFLSIECVVDFFSDKDFVYRKASREMAISSLYAYLCMMAYYGERELFCCLKTMIVKNYKDFYSVIGWNRQLKKYLMGSYCVNQLYQRKRMLRHLYAFIIRYIKI